MANKQRRTTIQGEAWKALEKMLGKSLKVINAELEDSQIVALMNKDGTFQLDKNGMPVTTRIGGNPKVAMWLADKITGNTGGLLLREVGTGSLATMEEVIATAQHAVELVVAREMALQDAEKLIDLLLRYATIRAFDGMEELRKQLTELQAKTINSTAGAPMEMRPSWGKLQQMTAINEGRPAE